MDVLLLLAGTILVFAIYKQLTSEPTIADALKPDTSETLMIGDYNPYILNQYDEWKNRIHSADVQENDIYQKPVSREFGPYGITEEQVRLNAVDAKVPILRRQNLNL
jgi:hypothetical protein